MTYDLSELERLLSASESDIDALLELQTALDLVAPAMIADLRRYREGLKRAERYMVCALHEVNGGLLDSSDKEGLSGQACFSLRREIREALGDA